MAASTVVPSSLRPSPSSLLPGLRQFGFREWALAVVAGVGYAILIGIPMVMIDTPWFGRMTPVRPQDRIVWVVSAVLMGLIAATFVRWPRNVANKRVTVGGFLSYLAIGCPICNKVAIMLLGVSGALTFFGPAQLVLGILSVLLLGWALLLRTDAMVGASCTTRPAGTPIGRPAGQAGG